MSVDGDWENDAQQAQLRKIQESTQTLSPAQLQARREAAERDIKMADTQIAKYKQTVEQMKVQENWTKEQAAQYAYKNNMYPKIGEKARQLAEERARQIEKMESAKKVLQAWLKQT